MELDEKQRKQIEEIISRIQCQKDFECYKSGFSKMGKVRDIGIKNFVECLEDNPAACNYSMAFGNGYFCKCPVRIYIAKNLEKRKAGTY